MKIQHPDFPELTKDIEGKATATKWLKAGWLEVKPKAAKKTAETPPEKPAS